MLLKISKKYFVHFWNKMVKNRETYEQTDTVASKGLVTWGQSDPKAQDTIILRYPGETLGCIYLSHETTAEGFFCKIKKKTSSIAESG